MTSAIDIPLGPRRAMFSSPLDLVGVAYARGGVTPDIGFDCFTLLCFVRWHWFARCTPFAGIPARKLTCAQACAIGIRRALGRGNAEPVLPWRRIAEPIEGCAVALGRMRCGRLHHCGVWVQGGVLHAYERLGVAWTPGTRLAELFARVEFYECAPA